MNMDVVALARELIDIPSVTGDEAAVAEHIERLLRRGGIDVTRHQIGDGRFNLVAGPKGRARVVFCSHLDTVPPFIPATEDDEYLYGRGACDAKGIIAAMIVAAERLWSSGVDSVGVLFVVGEETDSAGARRANEELSPNSEFLVVGEPTESRFVSASKGALTCTVRFEGVAAHSAYPERGESAIRKLTGAIEALYGSFWGEDPSFGRGTINVGVVRGGEKPNIIPAWAEADMIFRTVEPAGVVLRRLQEIIAPFGGQVVYSHGNDPMMMYVPDRHEPVVVAFNTDVPHLSRFGKPLLFGPGSILDAHTAGEKIAKRELSSAVDTYVELTTRLLSGELRRDG